MDSRREDSPVSNGSAVSLEGQLTGGSSRLSSSTSHSQSSSNVSMRHGTSTSQSLSTSQVSQAGSYRQSPRKTPNPDDLKPSIAASFIKAAATSPQDASLRHILDDSGFSSPMSKGFMGSGEFSDCGSHSFQSATSLVFDYATMKQLLTNKSALNSFGTGELLKQTSKFINSEDVDFRVRLNGPDGPIPIGMWDLSRYKFWLHDHYQELRREWIRQKEGESNSIVFFSMPHPGVDYFYSQREFPTQSGVVPLTGMVAQCVLPDKTMMTADMQLDYFARRFSREQEPKVQHPSCFSCLQHQEGFCS